MRSWRPISKKNGLREAILVDAEGRILDGRDRYRACFAAGVGPRFVEWQGAGSLPELALSLNLHRRHLDESQRAMVAARLAKLMETEALKRQGRRPNLAANLQRSQFGRSGNKAAAQINVSPRLVHYAIKVLQNGSDELIAAVESGDLAVSTASVLAGLPQDEQAKALAAGTRHAAGKAREIRAAKSAASAPRPSPGRFGVLRVETPGERENTVVDGVVFLWVAAGGLADAIEALQARGFEYGG